MYHCFCYGLCKMEWTPTWFSKTCSNVFIQYFTIDQFCRTVAVINLNRTYHNTINTYINHNFRLRIQTPTARLSSFLTFSILLTMVIVIVPNPLINIQSNSKNGRADSCVRSIINPCVIETNDAWTTEHAHAKSNVVDGDEPKWKEVGNTATVGRGGAIVILHIREVGIDPHTAHYEPDEKKQVNKEENDVEESQGICILFCVDFILIFRATAQTSCDCITK